VATVVLVPGACHGGWWFEPLARRLAGVSERAGELTGRVNLESHVAETVELVRATAAEQVVLVAAAAHRPCHWHTGCATGTDGVGTRALALSHRLCDDQRRRPHTVRRAGTRTSDTTHESELMCHV